jgi:hypothetical protein
MQVMLMGRRQDFIDRALQVLGREGIACAGEYQARGGMM